MVASTRISVSLESSDNQQEIQEIGSGEATSRQGDTRYVFVTSKENIRLLIFLFFNMSQ